MHPRTPIAGEEHTGMSEHHADVNYLRHFSEPSAVHAMRGVIVVTHQSLSLSGRILFVAHFEYPRRVFLVDCRCMHGDKLSWFITRSSSETD